MSEQYSNPTPQAGPQTVRTLSRTPDDKMIAGVCGGLARYAGVDATLVRVAAVIGLFIGFPAILVGYLVAWAIMPRRDAPADHLIGG